MILRDLAELNQQGAVAERIGDMTLTDHRRVARRLVGKAINGVCSPSSMMSVASVRKSLD